MDIFVTGIAALGILLVAVPLGLIVLGLAVIFNGRGEPDPTGRRTTAIYLTAVHVITVLLVLFASVAAFGRLTSLIVDEDARGGSDSGLSVDDFGGFAEEDPFADDLDLGGSDSSANDASLRDTVRAGLIALPALAVLIFHWRRREQFVAEADHIGSQAWRAERVGFYLICFVAALTVLFAAGNAIYDIFRLVAPGVAGAEDAKVGRQMAISDFLTMTVLTVGALFVFFWHWNLLTGDQTPWDRFREQRATKAAAQAAQAPPAPAPQLPTPSAAPPPPPQAGQ